MYEDQFGQFVCGYWGLKGYSKHPHIRTHDFGGQAD